MTKAKQELEEKPVAAIGFGSQGEKRKRCGAVYVTEEQIKTESGNTRLSVSILKSASVDSRTQVELRKNIGQRSMACVPDMFSESSAPFVISFRNTKKDRLPYSFQHFNSAGLYMGPSSNVSEVSVQGFIL